MTRELQCAYRLFSSLIDPGYFHGLIPHGHQLHKSQFLCLLFCYNKVQHLLASKWESPNAVGARLPVITQLNIPAWDFFLQQYYDAQVVEFLRFGWPVSCTSEILPTSSSSNHPSAVAFPNHVEHYIHTELSYHTIAGPFSTYPLHQPLV